MTVTLQRLGADGSATVLRRIALDGDGRAGGPLLDAQAMSRGRYRLLFEVAPYFRARGVALPEPPFIDTVQIDFGIAEAGEHYHVPLLVSPWSYSTYRGSGGPPDYRAARPVKAGRVAARAVQGSRFVGHPIRHHLRRRQ